MTLGFFCYRLSNKGQTLLSKGGRHAHQLGRHAAHGEADNTDCHNLLRAAKISHQNESSGGHWHPMNRIVT